VKFDMVDDYALASDKHSDVVLLGFGDLSLEQIEEGVRRLASVLCAAGCVSPLVSIFSIGRVRLDKRLRQRG
jgi:hypothetical protein